MAIREFRFCKINHFKNGAGGLQLVNQKPVAGFSYTSTLITVMIHNKTTGACYGQ